MPHQNLDSAVMLAIGIWLLALFVFGLMILAVLAKLISENRSAKKYGSGEDLLTTIQQPSPGHENIVAEEGD